MKITKFNQKLVKRLVSYTLAGSLAITSAPIKIVKASDKICPEEKTICEVKNFNDSYKIEIKNGNEIKVTQVKGRNEVTSITIEASGEATIRSNKRGIFGFGKYEEKEKFTIDYFDGETLKITKDCINNNDTNKCLDSLQDYFNQYSFQNTNYFAEYGELFGSSTIDVDYNSALSLTQAEYHGMLSQMITDLNANGQDMQIDELKIALGASMLPTLAFSGDAAVASGAALTIPGGKVIIAVAFIAMLYYVYSYDSGAVLTLNQVLDGIYYDQEDTNTETKDNSLDGYVLLEKEMEKVKENKNDDDPNNDYYDAKFSKELEVVIDLENPYGKDVAVQKIIREISRGNPNWYTTNIYTLDINDAIEIIKDAGCVPGPHKDKGAQGLEEIPENHAFTQSYNLFNSNVSLDDYLRGIDGQYCWHFHPLDPITLQIKSKMHILFGVVVKIENGFMSVCILPRDEFLTYCINNFTKKEKKLTKVRRL